MPPFPQDSDDDPEDIFVSNDDDIDLQYDEGDMENAIILDDNDAPGNQKTNDQLFELETRFLFCRDHFEDSGLEAKK